MKHTIISIKARDLKPGDVLATGAKVISAKVEKVVGYNVEEVNIVDDKLTYPVVGWSCSPDTDLRVTRTA